MFEIVYAILIRWKKKWRVWHMLTEQQIRVEVSKIVDPLLGVTLADTNGILEVRINEEKNHVSLKLAIGEEGGGEQLHVQNQVVEVVKGLGANTVGLRFEKLPDKTIKKFVDENGQRNPLANVEVIAIASGKGGVGKSTLTANLAVALARKGKRVGLIDCDIYGFSIPDMMGIEDGLRVENERIIPAERFGVKVVSMGFFVEDNSPIIWRGPMLGKAIAQFLEDVEWGELDYLLLDLPPGTGDVQMDLHKMIPDFKEIIITTPHPTAAYVATRAATLALKTEHELIGVVENMSYYISQQTGVKEYIFGKGGGEILAKEVGTELLAQIPLEQPAYEIADAMEAVEFAPSIYKESDPNVKYFDQIADKIISR